MPFLPCVFGSLALSLSAADIRLSGTVVGRGEAPLPGVVVALSPSGLADTTDSEGKWLIAGASVRSIPEPSATSARWNGRNLSLMLSAPALVQADAYDIAGSKVGSLPPTRLASGIHDLKIDGPRSSRTMEWVRLSVDGRVQVLASGGGTRASHAALLGPPSRAMSDSVQKLAYTFQGQLVDIDTLSGNGTSSFEERILAFEVRGYTAADLRVKVDGMSARFEGGHLGGIRREPLAYHDSTGTYSGRILVGTHRADSSGNFRIWVDVSGNGGRRTGVSDTTAFSTGVEVIDFIPVIGVANVIPAGGIAGGAAGMADSIYPFQISLARIGNTILSTEWDLDDGQGFQSGGMSVTAKWHEPGTYHVRARVADVEGNAAVFTRTVNITTKAIPVSAVRDLSIGAGDVVLFSLRAADWDGVSKVLWNFGDGQTDSSFVGDIYTASHRYPGAEIVRPGTTVVYPLTVTVVDSLGNPTVTRRNITVSNISPEVAITDAEGGCDSLLALHATVTNQVRISLVEWSLDGLTFQAGGLDTLVRLPHVPTANFPVFVRVTGENGNVSKVDTGRVIIHGWMTDPRDGRKYRIAPIGAQIWMAQNLNFKTDSSWWYNNDSDTGAKYGRVYTWASAMGLDDSCNRKGCAAQVRPKTQGACPPQWHVPTDREWTILVTTVEADPRVGVAEGGTALKTWSGWIPNGYLDGNGTDLFGFRGIPSGAKWIGGIHLIRGGDANWWSADEFNASLAWVRSLESDLPILVRDHIDKSVGFSIRCVAD